MPAPRRLAFVKKAPTPKPIVQWIATGIVSAAAILCMAIAMHHIYC